VSFSPESQRSGFLFCGSFKPQVCVESKQLRAIKKISSKCEFCGVSSSKGIIKGLVCCSKCYFQQKMISKKEVLAH